MTCNPDLESISRLASRQGSLWLRSQAREAGVTNKMIRRRIADGTWLDHGHGVLGVPGVPWTHRRWLWRAHLATGPVSVVSHEAAAATHRLRGYQGEPIVVTRPHGAWSGFDDIVVHQLDDCGPADRVCLDGLPVTNIERTFVDLAAGGWPARLEVAVEEELSRGRVSIGSIAVALDRVARPGKPGVHRLQDILDRQIGARPGASRLESMMEIELRQLRGIQFVTEVALPSRGDVVGIVDFAIPSCRVVIEVDGPAVARSPSGHDPGPRSRQCRGCSRLADDSLHVGAPRQ